MKMIVVSILSAALLAGGTWMVLSRRSETPLAPDTSAEQLAALQRKLDESEAARMATQQALEEAEERNRMLESDLADAQAALEDRAAPDETLLQEEPGSEENSDDRKRSLEDIRRRLESTPAASAQIRALTELVYADLLNSLDLDPEGKAELRELLMDSMMQSLALSQYAMLDGKLLWSEVRSWELEERAYLDARIKELLLPESYKTWEEYFADIDAHQLEGNLRNQIAAVASGLTPGNFDLVLQVAVEEFRAQQIALEQSNQLFTMAENIHYQLRAMEAMRTRLAAALAEDQFAEIENWLTMAERLLNAQLPQEN